jgi:hypothetical protein
VQRLYQWWRMLQKWRLYYPRSEETLESFKWTSFSNNPIKKTAGLPATSSCTHIHDTHREWCCKNLEGTELASSIQQADAKDENKIKKCSFLLNDLFIILGI